MSINYSGYWSFICNPKSWNIEKLLKDMKRGEIPSTDSWTVPEYMKDKFEIGQYGLIRVGKDRRAKRNLKPNENKLESGIYAVVKIISYSKKKDREYGYDKDYNLDNKSSYLKAKYYVEIEYLTNLIDNPLTIENIKKNEIICKDPYLIKSFQASAIPIQKEAFEEVLEYLEKSILPLSDNTKSKIETETLSNIKTRIGQNKFRNALLEKYNSCQLCGLKNTKLLVASHIKPWAYSTSKERLNVNNGLLLCPNHDSLFDKGLISFKSNGKIIISDEINKEDYRLLNISSKNSISHISSKNYNYLKWHRDFYKEKLFPNRER